VPERSKTKTRILKTARELFNNEGEAQVSAVDVASVMGISPGNLYYHYKGKSEIIKALFEDFEEEIRLILSGPITKPLSLQDNWVYLYIIFEEIYDFRFFYRNMSDIIMRIPELQGPFSRILALKEQTAFSIVSDLEKAGYLEFGEAEKGALAGRLTQHFTFWLQYHDLRNGTTPPKILIDQGVYTTLIQITPFWTRDGNGHSYAENLQKFLEGQS